MKKFSRTIMTLLVSLFVFLAILISAVMFNSSVSKRLQSSTQETLSEISLQQQFAFQMKLENERETLESVAETLVLFGYDQEAIVTYIRTADTHSGASDIVVVDETTGLGIAANGDIIDISDQEYFHEAKMGDFIFTEPSESIITGEMVITAAIPIYEFGEVAGVLVAEYPLEYLREFLSSAFGGNSYTAVVNRNGIVMLESFDLYKPGADLYQIFNMVAIANNRSADEVLDDVYNGIGGSIEYTYKEETKLADYRPVGFNDWSILTLIPIEVIDDEVNAIFISMSVVTGVVIFCFVVFLIYILVTERKSLKTVERLAYYDELTGLYNLTKLKIDAKKQLEQHPNTEFVIIKFDFVNFKAINELFSFETGNHILRTVKVVSDTVKDSSYMHARVGVDEFMFFAKASVFTDFKEGRKVFETMYKDLLKDVGIDKHRLNFRYGRYIIPKGETDIDEIVNRVNLAHTHTKVEGAELFSDYDDNFKKQLLSATNIINKMESALENGDFKAYLQPKHNLANGKIVGAEALVRWIEPNGNMIYPNEFIPIFESNGFIAQLDMHMLEQVCIILKELEQDKDSRIPISVNFSRIHLNNPHFIDEIVEIVDRHNIPHKYIEIELTETAFTEKEMELEDVFKNLQQNGFAISIDDFGSGYSSLGMLKNFNVDTLKIDRSFFVNTSDNERGKTVVTSVIDLAHKLNMYTVAEGVELQDQIDFLKEIDCEAAQGYFYTRPMPFEDFKKLER